MPEELIDLQQVPRGACGGEKWKEEIKREKLSDGRMGKGSVRVPGKTSH